MLDIIRSLPPIVHTGEKLFGGRGTGQSIRLPEGLPEDRIVQVGTRHALLVRQATKARYAGMSQDECLSFLTEWVNRQDPTLIESDPNKIDQDIQHLVRWMYGDTFFLYDESQSEPQDKEVRDKDHWHRKARDEIVLTQEDIVLVLGQSSRSLRRLLFLLIAIDKAGRPEITQKRLGELVGISIRMVEKNINRLEKEGRIQRIHRRPTKYENGKYYQPSNSYRVRGIRWDQQREENGVDSSGALSMDKLLSSFDAVYYETMSTMTDGMDEMNATDKKDGRVLYTAAFTAELEAYRNRSMQKSNMKSEPNDRAPLAEVGVQEGSTK